MAPRAGVCHGRGEPGELPIADAVGDDPGRRRVMPVSVAARGAAVIGPNDPSPDRAAKIPNRPLDVAKRAAGLIAERRTVAATAHKEGAVGGPAIEDGRAYPEAGTVVESRKARGERGRGDQAHDQEDDQPGGQPVSPRRGARPVRQSSQRTSPPRRSRRSV
jgi:hypothetical protein